MTLSLRKWLQKRKRMRRERDYRELPKLDLQLGRLYYAKELEQVEVREFLHRREDNGYVV